MRATPELVEVVLQARAEALGPDLVAYRNHIDLTVRQLLRHPLHPLPMVRW